MVTQICEIPSDILEAPPSEVWPPKNMKFWRNFRQIRDLIANVSGTQQDIINQKTALHLWTLAQANLFCCTLVHKRLEIGPEF